MLYLCIDCWFRSELGIVSNEKNLKCAVTCESVCSSCGDPMRLAPHLHPDTTLTHNMSELRDWRKKLKMLPVFINLKYVRWPVRLKTLNWSFNGHKTDHSQMFHCAVPVRLQESVDYILVIKCLLFLMFILTFAPRDRNIVYFRRYRKRTQLSKSESMLIILFCYWILMRMTMSCLVREKNRDSMVVDFWSINPITSFVEENLVNTA